jgi:hypothetical protein
MVGSGGKISKMQSQQGFGFFAIEMNALLRPRQRHRNPAGSFLVQMLDARYSALLYRSSYETGNTCVLRNHRSFYGTGSRIVALRSYISSDYGSADRPAQEWLGFERKNGRILEEEHLEMRHW